MKEYVMIAYIIIAIIVILAILAFIKEIPAIKRYYKMTRM